MGEILFCKDVFGIYHKSSLYSSVTEKLLSTDKDEHIIGSQDTAGTVPPTACRFSRGGNCDLLAIADEDGGVLILNAAMCADSSKQDFLAHDNAIFDISWLKNELKLLTASADKSIALWDVSKQCKLSEFSGHTSSVKKIDLDINSNAVFASGSRDGHVMVWDMRIKAKGSSIPAVNVIRNPHALQQVIAKRRKRKTDNLSDLQHGVSSVVFQDSNTLISGGSCDGDVKVWDLRKTYSNLKAAPIPRETFVYEKTSGRSFGIGSLVLDSHRTRLYASCMDHTIYQYDCASFNPKPVCSFHGHETGSFYVKTAISPDDAFLISGSSDNHAYIWQLDDPRALPISLQGHTKEVCDVTWHPKDIGVVVTSSDDCSVRIWRTDPFFNAEKCPYEPGDVIGRAVMSHRTIGVNTESPIGALRSSTVSRQKSLRTMRCGSSSRSSDVTLVKKPPSSLSSPERTVTLNRGLMPFISPGKAAQISPSPRKQPHYKLSDVANAPAAVGSGVPSTSRGAPQSPGKALAGRLAMTPKKHTVLPCAPAELSDQMKHAVQTLSTLSPEKHKAKQPTSLTSWLKKTITARKSPKQLIITPKKVQEYKANDKPNETKSADVKSVKRKLTDSYETCKKRLKLSETDDISETVDTPNDVRKVETGKIPCSSRSSSAKSTASPVQSQFQDVTNTPSKHSLTSPTQAYRSPTVNLPNYVLNPEPRTPVGRSMTSSENKTPNWLTQMRRQRSLETPESPRQNTEGNKTPKAPSKAENTQVTNLVKSSKKRTTPKRPSGTILKYLSPKP